MALCSACDASYLVRAGGFVPVFVRKEVIHVSLSPVRGFSEGVDHLEHEFVRGKRLTKSI